MIIRFLVKNLFSFKDQTEFNLLPNKGTRLKEHKYKVNGIEVLKLTALYGANGSGKSNFIRSVSLLKQLVVVGTIPNSLNNQKFKLSESSLHEPVELGMEFFCNNAIYYYTVSINNGIIIDEYFGETNIHKEEDTLIFHRTTADKRNTIKFFDEFLETPENKVLKNVIESDLLKPNQPLFTLLNSLSNDAFIDIKAAFDWFDKGLTIIYPDTKASGLTLALDAQSGLKDFANDILCSFNTGIINLKIDSTNLEEFLGKDNEKRIEEITTELTNNPDKRMALLENGSTGEEVSIVNENGKILTKRLLFEHKGEKSQIIDFKFQEESDGTRRLLEYIPALNMVIHGNPTFIIDEIERSIHPLIIKELISKFSKDTSTKGQLIFSTHESNLLDQDIFRTDEIWFAEKNQFGATRLYSLSDFKEHNTIDIRKGYLSGRYGAIPFLGNLHDLNWNKFTDAGAE